MLGLLQQSWQWIGSNSTELIALSALFLALYQACLSRKHNQISVQPYLVRSITRNVFPENCSLELLLSNNGIGPAKITEWKLCYDGDLSKEIDESNFKSSLIKLMEKRKFDYSSGNMSKGYIMSTNEKVLVLRIVFKASSEEEFETIEKKLNRFDLHVRYESLYGAKFTMDTTSE